jgi:hypothetical protein
MAPCTYRAVCKAAGAHLDGEGLEVEDILDNILERVRARDPREVLVHVCHGDGGV